MFYFYILKSQVNNSYYIGSCKDLIKRLSLHNSRQVKSTKRFMPWIIVYHEEFDFLTKARSRELEIKSWKKRVKIEGLIKHFNQSRESSKTKVGP